MNIVLFGPPGAGKGTQSENLAKDLNLFKVSTGDLLREEVKNKSSLGIKIKSIIYILLYQLIIEWEFKRVIEEYK